jgi:hypothetical protein
MKIRALTIIGLLILTNISIVGASSLSLSNKNQVNEKGIYGTDGRIYGWVETQTRCMRIGVPDLKVACGKNLNNYEIAVTDEDGFFEFSDLMYKISVTTYFIWILPNQKVILPELKKVKLNDKNPEEDVYYYVLLWRSLSKDKLI